MSLSPSVRETLHQAFLERAYDALARFGHLPFRKRWAAATPFLLAPLERAEKGGAVLPMMAKPWARALGLYVANGSHEGIHFGASELAGVLAAG